MKRSEMVEKLGQFLNKELKIVSINAEPILDFLEKEGMFPPNYETKTPNPFVGGFCTKEGWEPEDE